MKFQKEILNRKGLAALALALSFNMAATSSFATIIKLTAKAESGDRPAIVGSTNLPLGTSLIVTMSRREGSYEAQGKASVAADGTFKTEPFSLGRRGLNPGVYSVEVITPMPEVQSKSVADFMGKGGKNLQGPLVIKSVLGGKIVEFKTKTKIGGDVNSSDNDKVARIENQVSKHQWWLRSCKDTCTVTAKQAAELDSCYSTCAAGEPARK